MSQRVEFKVQQEGSLCAKLVDLACESQLSVPLRNKFLTALLVNVDKLDSSVCALLKSSEDMSFEEVAAVVVMKWAARVLTSCAIKREEVPKYFPVELLNGGAGLQEQVLQLGTLIAVGHGDPPVERRVQALRVLETAVGVPAWKEDQQIFFEVVPSIIEGLPHLQDSKEVSYWGDTLAAFAQAGYDWSPEQCRSFLDILREGSRGVRRAVLTVLSNIPPEKWQGPLTSQDTAVLRQCLQDKKQCPDAFKFLGVISPEERIEFYPDLLSGFGSPEDQALMVLMSTEFSDLSAVCVWLKENWKRLKTVEWCRVAMLLAPYGEKALCAMQWLAKGALVVGSEDTAELKICWRDAQINAEAEVVSHSYLREQQGVVLDHYFKRLVQISGSQGERSLVVILHELKLHEERSAKEDLHSVDKAMLAGERRRILASAWEAFAAIVSPKWKFLTLRALFNDQEHPQLAEAGVNLLNGEEGQLMEPLVRKALLSPVYRVRSKTLDLLARSSIKAKWFIPMGDTLIQMVECYGSDEAKEVTRMIDSFDLSQSDPLERGVLFEVLLTAASKMSSKQFHRLDELFTRLTAEQELALIVANS